MTDRPEVPIGRAPNQFAELSSVTGRYSVSTSAVGAGVSLRKACGSTEVSVTVVPHAGMAWTDRVRLPMSLSFTVMIRSETTNGVQGGSLTLREIVAMPSSIESFSRTLTVRYLTAPVSASDHVSVGGSTVSTLVSLLSKLITAGHPVATIHRCANLYVLPSSRT